MARPSQIWSDPAVYGQTRPLYGQTRPLVIYYQRRNGIYSKAYSDAHDISLKIIKLKILAKGYNISLKNFQKDNIPFREYFQFFKGYKNPSKLMQKHNQWRSSKEPAQFNGQTRPIYGQTHPLYGYTRPYIARPDDYKAKPSNI